MRNKIFISHSSKDVNFVKSFVDNVLKLGLDISAERIFCSSMEGQGVSSGQYIPDRLREEINLSSVALLFISENYKSSEVCLNEVGAAWAVLEKNNIIPILLPNITFDKLGFLDFGRLGLKIDNRSSIMQLVQDCCSELNPNYNLNRLDYYINIFLNILPKSENKVLQNKEINEWEDCFTHNLYALDNIIRKAIPTRSDGVHQIVDVKVQSQLFGELSNAKFLNRFWFRFSGGDYYVQSLKKLPSGSWLMSTHNWEIKILEMWVSMNCELQYECILIKSAALEPYKIDSDVGGESYVVGVLNDGTIVSENEKLNGYAIINGLTIDLEEYKVEPRERRDKSHWIFLVSSYHKAGYNPEKTIEFCKKLDSEQIEINEQNIMQFFFSLKNHPTVMAYN
jgi:hypothetical protein